MEITDNTTIHGLCQLIKMHLEGSVNTVAVFKESDCSRASYLAPSTCLYHCGAVGGPKTRPMGVELFYDYKPVMNDCPLLMDESHLVDVKELHKKKAPSHSGLRTKTN